MSEAEAGSIGIFPPGALGVTFFYHLTQKLTRLDLPVRFLGLSGSRSLRSLKEAGFLQIKDETGTHSVPVAEQIDLDLETSQNYRQLPELILVATNPDQQLAVIDEMIRLLERLNRERAPEDLTLPPFIFCANGIYFQRLRQVFIEKLEESTLLGRLPDLWPDLMPRLVGKVMRGVTIQSGLRDGEEAAAVYRPGASAITRIAGGDRQERQWCADRLARTGAWFEAVTDLSPTRVEFDKAMVNLASNLLGIIYSIDGRGNFSPLTVGQVFSPDHRAEIKYLLNEVLKIGKTVKAYREEHSIDQIMDEMDAMVQTHRNHVPSSIQYVSMLLRRGLLKGESTPTEEWLLQPLIKYAEAAELYPSAAFLKEVRQRLIASLTAASQAARLSASQV